MGLYLGYLSNSGTPDLRYQAISFFRQKKLGFVNIINQVRPIMLKFYVYLFVGFRNPRNSRDFPGNHFFSGEEKKVRDPGIPGERSQFRTVSSSHSYAKMRGIMRFSLQFISECMDILSKKQCEWLKHYCTSFENIGMWLSVFGDCKKTCGFCGKNVKL